MRRLADPVLQEMAKDLMRRTDITDPVRTRYLRKLDDVDQQLAQVEAERQAAAAKKSGKKKTKDDDAKDEGGQDSPSASAASDQTQDT